MRWRRSKPPAGGVAPRTVAEGRTVVQRVRERQAQVAAQRSLTAVLKIIALAGVACAWPTLAPAATAQIEEIIVTAQKREESLQEVPIAVTAINAAVLEENKIYNVYTL